MQNQKIFQEAQRAISENQPTALATIVRASGSTPTRIGAKMLVYQDESISGTIGGGALEAKIIKEAQQVMANNKGELFELNLDNKEASDLGMVCGGNVSVFVEPLLSSPTLVLVGAGHISQEIAKLAQHLDYRLIVMDDRPEFASQENFPKADQLFTSEISESLTEFPVDANTHVVIVTRGHYYDQTALEQVIDTDAAYVGMIGSEKKVKSVFDDLSEQGYEQATLDKIYAPIGLDIGGDTPAEIAVSIIAEIQKERYKKGKDKPKGGE